jgi:Xaa-Pro dipeptidase
MMIQKETAFDQAEYLDRVKRVQDVMNKSGMDLLLVHEIGNICWLCGVQCLCWNKYFMLAVPQKGSPYLLIQSFELYNAYLGTHLDETQIIPYYSCEVGKPEEDPLEASVRLVRELGRETGVIGLEYDTPCVGISAGGFARIKEQLRTAAFVNASGLVERVRLVKSPAELSYIRQAAQIASAAMATVLTQAAVGMTDNDLAAIAHESLARHGSEYMCLDPIITIGPRSGVPHTTYARHVIQAGDTGLLEFGACINRYTGVTMRSVSFGEPSDQVRHMAEGCINSIDTVIANARPGALCHDVAAKARLQLGSHLDRYMWHGLYGYSVGLGFPPRWDDCGDIFIKEDDYHVLEPNMCFHVSTTLRDLGRHSITASETVAITETGCQVLTSVPRRLFVK